MSFHMKASLNAIRLLVKRYRSVTITSPLFTSLEIAELIVGHVVPNRSAI